MKVLKIDHLGVAVKSIESALKFYSKILGLKLEAEEVIAELKVRIAFLPIGDTKVELLESIAPDSPVEKFIENKGEGLHHISFEVDELDLGLRELEKKGVGLIDFTPRLGAGNKRIAFLDPKDTFGVLVELSEDI